MNNATRQTANANCQALKRSHYVSDKDFMRAVEIKYGTNITDNPMRMPSRIRKLYMRYYKEDKLQRIRNKIVGATTAEPTYDNWRLGLFKLGER